ncbi:hypothetical protein FRC01_007064 [Tulasnella sp. 417]|nr:hypothetical protein FRC01_007064 [Tulasnella sp. 417]
MTNAQAALWLLEMASSRDDQLIAVRFLCSTPREACATAILTSERRQLLISLTLEAFDIWRSQPNEKTQETVEHFGRALCHVIPQTRGSAERWKELTPPQQGRRPSLGERFLLELASLEDIPHFSGLVGEEYVLQSAVLRTLILTKYIPIETYRWTNLTFLIREEGPDSQLLGLWAKLMYEKSGYPEKYHLRRVQSASGAVSKKGRYRTKRDVSDDDFPLALACGAHALKSVERHASSEDVASTVLDVIEIYTACVQKTTQLAEAGQLLPAFQEPTTDGIMEIMAYCEKSSFLKPPEQQLIDFICSALQLLRSIHGAGYTPKLDDAAFEGLWNALESIISAIGGSSEIKRVFMEDLVIQTLESISDCLPVKFGVHTPMVGLEVHPQIMQYITSHVATDPQRADDRVMDLIYRNRFRWFTQASSALRTAWMDTGLSSHLVDALRRPYAWKGRALLVYILEDTTEMSMEWSRRLVADGFLPSVADVIVYFDHAEDGNTLRWRYIQCRLAKTLLSVWRHCSAIPEIKWPMEKLLRAIQSARSASEDLLGREATPIDPEARALPNVTIGKEAILGIRDKIKLFLDWSNERVPESALTSSDAPQLEASPYPT